MLEELRVSLFAQSLGTAHPVSVKRVEAKWRELGLQGGLHGHQPKRRGASDGSFYKITKKTFLEIDKVKLTANIQTRNGNNPGGTWWGCPQRGRK